MKEVDVSALYNERDFFGIIMPCMSGVRWANQAGGTLCSHPAIEGVYVPLPMLSIEDADDPLRDFVLPYNEERVREFLAAYDLGGSFEPVKDIEAIPPCFTPSGSEPIRLMEAWVPVLINKNPPEELRPFAGQWGVLVYTNSD